MMEIFKFPSFEQLTYVQYSHYSFTGIQVFLFMNKQAYFTFLNIVPNEFDLKGEMIGIR